MTELRQDVPLAARLALGRAAVQTLAAGLGVRLLHIKGNAVDPGLRAAAAVGTDVDVLAHPAEIPRLHGALAAHGWELYSTFAHGSPFEHAQTYWHPMWGYLDLHRLFPGVRVDAAAAFERLWRTSGEREIAGVACRVPDPDAQLLILILNAARAGGVPGTDLAAVWDAAAARRRAAVYGLVDELEARVAFAAAFGRLDEVAGERDHLLWRVVAQGGTRVEEWRGRIRAAPSRRAAVRIAARAILVNPDQLRHRLGRQPRVTDIAADLARRIAVAVRDVLPGRRP